MPLPLLSKAAFKWFRDLQAALHWQWALILFELNRELLAVSWLRATL